MKPTPRRDSHRNFPRLKVLAGMAAFVAAALPAGAAPLGQAVITQVENDVRHQAPGSTERPAKVKDVVRGTDTVRTGSKSQAELEFEDRTITRLGANSIFTFDPGQRQFELKRGWLLFDMPKGAGGGRIVTPAGTAAIEGTAGIVCVRSPLRVICLAGQIQLLGPQGNVLAMLRAGEMFIPGVTPRPVRVNLRQLIGAVRILGTGLRNNQQELRDAMNQQGADGGKLENPPPWAGGADPGGESLGRTRGEMALKFARTIQPPYRGNDVREAVLFLMMRFPPVMPVGGWGDLDLPASRDDLVQLICRYLRLPIPNDKMEDPAAYWQALMDYIGSTNEQSVHANLGLFRELWADLLFRDNYLTESERDTMNGSFDPANKRPNSSEPQPGRARTPI
jgi:hypothetical protein